MAKSVGRIDQTVTFRLLPVMNESEEQQKSLGFARKNSERLTESYPDLDQQIVFLQEERKRLEKKLLQARLRDIPEQAEIAADTFDKIRIAPFSPQLPSK